jgi:hypothetical protein
MQFTVILSSRHFQRHGLGQAHQTVFGGHISGLERAGAQAWAEAMLTIRPRPCSRMIGTACFMV